jgi:uncharacterized protein YvpB
MKINNNTWIHKTYEDFLKGSFNDTLAVNEESRYIILNKKNNAYVNEGIYTSNIIYSEPFKSMILSWNAFTPLGTAVKVEAQVLVNQGHLKLWSKWLPVAVWSTSSGRHSFKAEPAENDIAYVDTDTIIIKGLQDENACAVRYRLTLSTLNSENTPSINLVAGSIRSLASNESDWSLKLPYKELDVPRFSQMLRDPEIANVICSPTSLTMILNYHGLKLTPEETASLVYDSIYNGFGNWIFNTALAGNLGFESYVAYCNSITDLIPEICNNRPVAVSVKYKNSEQIDANLPVINGAPITKTNGHLIVVCGFANENHKNYIIVNDPAAANDQSVRLKYLASEFDSAWKASGRATYIIHPSK